MNWAEAELLKVVRQLRGGLAWHAETHPGQPIPMPEGFTVPSLGASPSQATDGMSQGRTVQARMVQGPTPSKPQGAGVSNATSSEESGDARLSAFLDEARGKTMGPARKPMGKLMATASPSNPSTQDHTQSQSGRSPSRLRTLSMPELGADMTEFDLRAVGLQRVREEANQCRACPLGGGRTEVVHGYGSSRARLMFVADGPGAAEDAVGVPFVGEAGLLLGRMVRAMGLKRNDVYLTHLVRCRTAGQPFEAGVETCGDFLQREIEVVRPEVIIALGELAARRFTESKEAFPHLRGRWVEYEGLPVMPTFHPLALLQHPQSKGRVWADLKLVMKKLDLTPPS